MGIDARITFKAPPPTLLPGGLSADTVCRMERLFVFEQARQAEALVLGRPVELSDHLRASSGVALSGPRTACVVAAVAAVTLGGAASRAAATVSVGRGAGGGGTGPGPSLEMGATDAAALTSAAWLHVDTTDGFGEDTAPPPSSDEYGGDAGSRERGGGWGGASSELTHHSLDDAARGLPFSEDLNAELMDALSAVVAGSGGTVGRAAAAGADADAAAAAVVGMDAALSGRMRYSRSHGPGDIGSNNSNNDNGGSGNPGGNHGNGIGTRSFGDFITL
jgi:hypothetical protein